MKHVGIEIKFYNLDTFIKQIDVNFIDLDSKLVDLNYKVASLIFCHFWRSINFLIGASLLALAKSIYYALSSALKVRLKVLHKVQHSFLSFLNDIELDHST